MESELGVALFARENGELSVTPAGASLLEHSNEVRRAFERFEASAQAARNGAAGRLLLASCPEARYELIPPLLEGFTAACPDVYVMRREQPVAEIVEDLLNERIDVAVAACVPALAGIERRALKPLEVRVLLASSHPLAESLSVRLRDLEDEPILISAGERSLGPYGCLQPLFDAVGFRPRRVVDAVGYDEDLHGVRRGDGLLLSARTFPGELPFGVASLGLEPRSTLPVELLWRADNRSAPLLSFVEFAEHTDAAQGGASG